MLYISNYSSTKCSPITRIWTKTEDSLQEILQSLFSCTTTPVVRYHNLYKQSGTKDTVVRWSSPMCCFNSKVMFSKANFRLPNNSALSSTIDEFLHCVHLAVCEKHPSLTLLWSLCLSEWWGPPDIIVGCSNIVEGPACRDPVRLYMTVTDWAVAGCSCLDEMPWLISEWVNTQNETKYMTKIWEPWGWDAQL